MGSDDEKSRAARQLRDCWHSFGNWIIFLIVLWSLVAILWICVYGYELHLYVSYKSPDIQNQCEKPLILWLLVDGVSGYVYLMALTIMILVLYFFIVKAVTANFESMDARQRQIEETRLMTPLFSMMAGAVVVALLSLFRTVWAILGSVWVYGIDSKNHKCVAEVYKFVWMRITLGWAWLGVLIIFICISVIAIIACARPNRALGSGDNDSSFSARVRF